MAAPVQATCPSDSSLSECTPVGLKNLEKDLSERVRHSRSLALLPVGFPKHLSPGQQKHYGIPAVGLSSKHLAIQDEQVTWVEKCPKHSGLGFLVSCPNRCWDGNVNYMDG